MSVVETVESARDHVETAQATLQVVDSVLEKTEDVAVEVVRARSKMRRFIRFLLFVAVIVGIAMAIKAIMDSQSSSEPPSYEPAPAPEPDAEQADDESGEVGDDDPEDATEEDAVDDDSADDEAAS
ncbi:MAG: hypothetical protein QNJ71_08255 [Acidimicrobiia bacterium]|nr:hypothetical protein [Acidimicrobiia bacterium]